ncbi:sigma-B regulation protein RsbU (phosphoserine phosphatase) [Tenuibacillus multivorans]|uniref:Sigma-B regulation protein RsbU (Phosphoserine phosphatase) n=1 Tax=Tenuibacillus multivorans TaxID=237069 RepID=A0A1H0BAS2_9BACI|nr:PP2C family protein-serine/threonine phosphatase [Tenuibacillus multivorans]SDN42745.1 sigma-B regulation protein RsbU (phosphoserine phosphatase) [Tenuibacillus multivorans]
MCSLRSDIGDYKELLRQYIKTKDEAVLYEAEQFSKSSIQNNISPDEIINEHYQAILELIPDLDERVKDSFYFLIETMISYGLAYQEYHVLREKQIELRAEIDVAANMQDTLLNTSIPNVEHIDIGAKSVPAKQMNGDYYHFVQDDEGNIGVAIADVIGKGIPAAFFMSMIKYAMESFPENRMYPKVILELLNRVVERNVESGMFVTMFYGLYDIYRHDFYYATAGHEPGFIYRAEDDYFEEIDAKGLLLGVKNDVKYRQYVNHIHNGDMIVLLTDGFTECRSGDRFIEREEVLDIIKQNKHLPANDIVENVYKSLERFQDFNMRDDFTLIIIKRNN